MIYNLISDICISMKAVDYLDMPECVYNRVEVVLTEKEMALSFFNALNRFALWDLKEDSSSITTMSKSKGMPLSFTKILIIGPLRVSRDTWPAELEKWDHLSGVGMSVALGSEKERLSALGRKAQVYVINKENVEWLVNESGIPNNALTLWLTINSFAYS